MSPAPWSLIAACRSFARGWNAFFHTPCDGRVVAIVRMAFAAVVLVHLAALYPDLDLWFSDAGYVPTDRVHKIASAYSWSLLNVTDTLTGGLLVPGSSASVHLCYGFAVLNAALLLVGCLPRVNAAMLFLWLVSFQSRNPIILDGEDNLMRVMAFFMIWLPSGACWSVNALVRRWWVARRGGSPATAQWPPLVAGWPLRLLQIEMAAMFLSTALMKWSGESWLKGTALYYVSRLDEHFGRFAVPAWAFDTPWLVALMTWSVLVVETAVPFLIWFRETRRPCLIVVLLFHLANEWSMNLFLFHWLMICGWLAFLSPDDLEWIWPRKKHAQLARPGAARADAPALGHALANAVQVVEPAQQ